MQSLPRIFVVGWKRCRKGFGKIFRLFLSQRRVGKRLQYALCVCPYEPFSSILKWHQPKVNIDARLATRLRRKLLLLIAFSASPPTSERKFGFSSRFIACKHSRDYRITLGVTNSAVKVCLHVARPLISGHCAWANHMIRQRWNPSLFCAAHRECQ